MTHQGQADSGVVTVDLTAEERTLLAQGLLQWDGPATRTDALAVAMGFAGVRDLLAESKRIAHAGIESPGSFDRPTAQPAFTAYASRASMYPSLSSWGSQVTLNAFRDNCTISSLLNWTAPCTATKFSFM